MARIESLARAGVILLLLVGWEAFARSGAVTAFMLPPFSAVAVRIWNDALTGDLPASRAAVRDSFVLASHHWRKISRLEDPETWARAHAWAHAQRRHSLVKGLEQIGDGRVLGKIDIERVRAGQIAQL